MTKIKRARRLSNPQLQANPFSRSIRDERPKDADEGTFVGGADVPTAHDLPEREPAAPSFGGTAGTADRYRTDDGKIHDERVGYRGWAARFAAPGYSPAVQNQFETSHPPGQSSAERDGEALGVVPTGVRPPQED